MGAVSGNWITHLLLKRTLTSSILTPYTMSWNLNGLTFAINVGEIYGGMMVGLLLAALYVVYS